jgi:3-oxoadipate enol-lactonase
VLLHGLGHDLGYWDAAAPALAAHHRVLRCDLRGFGASAKPPGPYTLGQYAADVDRFLAACGVAVAHVVGISMGGVIAQRLALDHPQRIRSLVLVSTSSEVGTKSIAVWQRLADAIERDGFDDRLADASRAFAPAYAAAHPDVVTAMTRRNAANDPRAYAAAARAVSDYNWTSALATITAPVLVLQGLADQLTPPGGSIKMTRGLPRARLLMVEGAGHNLPVEQPDVFQAAVLGFTAGVDLGAS